MGFGIGKTQEPLSDGIIADVASSIPFSSKQVEMAMREAQLAADADGAPTQVPNPLSVNRGCAVLDEEGYWGGIIRSLKSDIAAKEKNLERLKTLYKELSAKEGHLTDWQVAYYKKVMKQKELLFGLKAQVRSLRACTGHYQDGPMGRHFRENLWVANKKEKKASVSFNEAKLGLSATYNEKISTFKQIERIKNRITRQMSDAALLHQRLEMASRQLPR